MTLTNEQITAGAAIECDHGKPIGRNAAIAVFDAMTPTPAAPSGELLETAAFDKWAQIEYRNVDYYTNSNYAYGKAAWLARAAVSQAAPEQATKLLRKLVAALDGKRAAGEAGEPGFEFNDQLWALLEPARALAAPSGAPKQQLPSDWKEVVEALEECHAADGALDQDCPVCEQGKLIPLCTHYCNACGIEVGTTDDITENKRAMLAYKAASKAETAVACNAALRAAPAMPVDADARDAARYRWLTQGMGLRYSPPGGRAIADLDKMNAAIDAEIAATTKQVTP